MAARYGTRAKGGTKSILARMKRTATGDKSGAPKPRKNVSMLSSSDLIGLIKDGRPRDRNKFRNELSKRGVDLNKAA